MASSSSLYSCDKAEYAACMRGEKRERRAREIVRLASSCVHAIQDPPPSPGPAWATAACCFSLSSPAVAMTAATSSSSQAEIPTCRGQGRKGTETCMGGREEGRGTKSASMLIPPIPPAHRSVMSDAPLPDRNLSCRWRGHHWVAVHGTHGAHGGEGSINLIYMGHGGIIGWLFMGHMGHMGASSCCCTWEARGEQNGGTDKAAHDPPRPASPSSSAHLYMGNSYLPPPPPHLYMAMGKRWPGFLARMAR